eukprot:2434242-Pyramimonas_sp.AAC.1
MGEDEEMPTDPLHPKNIEISRRLATTCEKAVHLGILSRLSFHGAKWGLSGGCELADRHV